MGYPYIILRGIYNKTFIDDDGYPTADLFYFVKRGEQEERKDGLLAESINWKDDEGALESLLTQKKSGVIQFKAGAAVLSRIELDRLIKKPTVEGHSLAYEREPLLDNKYHGNLLLECTCTKRIMKRIAGAIATDCVTGVIPNSYAETASAESS